MTIGVDYPPDHDLRRRQPMLEYGRIAFGDPEMRALQREARAWRWAFFLTMAAFALHIAGHFLA